MASGVNVKLGVSGISQFKQGMKDSQAAVKNLEQQLKLNEAQLKATGNEELYLQNKTELLTKQIEEQKKTVSQATQALEGMKRNGVEQSSAAFQNMQQQMYKASTQLMEMQTELAGVGESGEEAADNVSEMNYQLNNISRNVSFDSVVNGIEKITDAMAEAGRAAYNMGKKIVQAVLSGGQWADDLQEKADKWEVSPEDAYRMEQTATQIDTDAETIVKARQKLIKAMGSESDKNIMGAFAALGISDLRGTDENIEDIFWKAGEALMDFDDKVARNEYAMALYGKNWNELIPIFKAGRESYYEMYNSWDWVGDKQFQALTMLDDESRKTKSAWENIQHTLEAAMAPAMTEIMVALQGMMSEFNKYLQSEEGQEMLSKLSEAVSSLFTDLTSLEPSEVVGKITEVFESIKAGLQWLIENRTHVFDALKLIAEGFALMKITSFAANIGRIVSGLTGLFSRNGTGGQGTGGQGGTEVLPTGTDGSSGSGGFWAGVVNKMTLVAGADAVYRATEGKIKELWEEFQTLTAGMSVEEKQKLATMQTLGMTESEYAAFMANKPAQEAANGSQYYGQDWRPSYMKDLENPMNKMSQVAGEMSGELAGVQQANTDMTAAAKDLLVLTSLPAEIRQAVADGMASVNIVINEGAVSAIGERVSVGWGGKVQAMTK